MNLLLGLWRKKSVQFFYCNLLLVLRLILTYEWLVYPFWPLDGSVALRRNSLSSLVFSLTLASFQQSFSVSIKLGSNIQYKTFKYCKLKTNIMFMDRFSQKYLTRLSVSCYCEPWVPCCVEVPLVTHLPLSWAGFLRERQPISFGTKGHQQVKL